MKSKNEKPKIELDHEDITLFAVTSPLESWDDYLVGTDDKGLTSFWGGKKDKDDPHIMGTIDREGIEEIGGTIFPANFDHPAYQQNFVFASRTVLPFFTSKKTQKLVEKKNLKHHLGDLKLRLGVRMFEVSGNTLPLQVNEKEMANPHYRKVSSAEDNMREAVRLILNLSEEQGIWKHQDLRLHDPLNPVPLDIKSLRRTLSDWGVTDGTLGQHFKLPDNFVYVPRQVRHLVPHASRAA